MTSGAYAAESADLLRIALSVVQDDLDAEMARQISNWIAPLAETQLTSVVRKNASICVSERIQECARWVEANGARPVVIEDAAQIADKSVRNFRRRFKLEAGMTPFDFLLYVRLDMSRRLPAKTKLPADKIARPCGIGDGGRLSKVFRKHLETTPTEYRASTQVVTENM